MLLTDLENSGTGGAHEIYDVPSRSFTNEGRYTLEEDTSGRTSRAENPLVRNHVLPYQPRFHQSHPWKKGLRTRTCETTSLGTTHDTTLARVQGGLKSKDGGATRSSTILGEWSVRASYAAGGGGAPECGECGQRAPAPE